MKELSLHIQDIAENSIRADATLLEIGIYEDTRANTLTITIDDDGCGMDAETVRKALNPFYTTKTVRKVGMGLSMFKQAAEQADGEFRVKSAPGHGTHVRAVFQLDHVDRQPLGDLAGVVVMLLMTRETMDIVLVHTIDNDRFEFDTRVIRNTLEDVSICESAVLQFIRDLINDRENLEEEEN